MSRSGAALLLGSTRLWGTRAQELWCTGSAAPRQVGSSWTRGRTRVSCIARWIQKHWTTREAPCFPLKTSKQNKTSSNSKESGDLSGIRTEPRVRPGRQGIEEVPNNSGIKRNDFQAILLKTTKKIKINAEIFHDEQNIPVWNNSCLFVTLLTLHRAGPGVHSRMQGVWKYDTTVRGQAYYLPTKQVPAVLGPPHCVWRGF